MDEENVSGTDSLTNVVSHLSNKPTKLIDVDRMALELSKSKREVALAEAKTALANNEKAELQYKYVVLQIYMKYGLTEADALNESGEIIYGGANKSETNS